MKIYPPLGVNDIGGRGNQEDSMMPSIGMATEQTRCFVVCDGMGGHDYGELASSVVAIALYENLAGKDAMSSILNSAMIAAYDALDSKNNEIDDTMMSKMGTTMTCLLLGSRSYLAAHVGDTRIYHFRPRYYSSEEPAAAILYKSFDHSLVNELVESGTITPDEARIHPRRNVITKAMMPHDVRHAPTVYESNNVEEDDIFLLCTDGVTEALTDEALTAIICTADSSDISKVGRLTEVCIAYHHDNFTFYYIRIRNV